jgi:hypothetical protein
MKLTGKCKQDFQNWYFNQEIFDDYYISYVPKKGMLDEFKCIDFKELPKSMQYGVYVDFFDSVGINIEITNDNKHIKTFWVDVNAKETDDIELNSRSEARTAAIKKANEIYNGK